MIPLWSLAGVFACFAIMWCAVIERLPDHVRGFCLIFGVVGGLGLLYAGCAASGQWLVTVSPACPDTTSAGER